MKRAASNKRFRESKSSSHSYSVGSIRRLEKRGRPGSLGELVSSRIKTFEYRPGASTILAVCRAVRTDSVIISERVSPEGSTHVTAVTGIAFGENCYGLELALLLPVVTEQEILSDGTPANTFRISLVLAMLARGFSVFSPAEL